MKRSVILLALLLASTAARAASAPRWPACAPVLTFSAKDIGVASYELDPSTRPAGAWLCLAIDRTKQHVRAVSKEDFDAEFPNAIAGAGKQAGDCQETLVPTTPAPNAGPNDGQPTCVSTKLFCAGETISVRVSSTVAALPCPARLFPAATIIDDRLWVSIAPLDPYRREYPGAGLLVQVLDGTVLSRLKPSDVGGRQVCAIRKDPFTNAVWVTTESGLAELTSSGKVKRVLQIRSPEGPRAQKPEASHPSAKKAPSVKAPAGKRSGGATPSGAPR